MSNSKKITYPVAFKEKAVRCYLEGGRSYQQLADEFGLKDKKTLREWVAKFQRGEPLEDGRPCSGTNGERAKRTVLPNN